MCRLSRYALVAAAVVTPLLGPPSHGAARTNVKPAPHSLVPLDVSTPLPEPLKLPNSALEPIDWNALGGWATDDHVAAFATFVTSCRPLLRTIVSKSETRPMYLALTHVSARHSLLADLPQSRHDAEAGLDGCARQINARLVTAATAAQIQIRARFTHRSWRGGRVGQHLRAAHKNPSASLLFCNQWAQVDDELGFANGLLKYDRPFYRWQ
jgi:hypothetical protein